MKVLAKILIAFIFVFGCTAFTACDGKPPVNPGTVPDEQEYFVEELIIRTPATKTRYYAGESVDLSGLTVEALWNDGVREVLSSFELEVKPDGAIDKGDREVTLSFEGASTQYAIEVNAAEMTGISLDIPKTVIRRIPAGSVCDFGSVEVNAEYSDGETRKIALYSASVDKEEVDLSALSFGEVGTKIVEVSCFGFSAEFRLEVFAGIVIEAENIIESKNVTKSDKNFVEKVNGGFYAFSKETEPASGGAYMGSVFKDAVMRFHVFVERDCFADIIFRASSGLMLVDGGAWSPVEMGDQQFNRMFEVSYGSAESAAQGGLTPLTVGDGVILNGGNTDKSEGDPLLYVNWTDVNIGSVHLTAGDNVIEFKVITDYVNCRGQEVACNIDRMEVVFRSEGGAV